MDPRIEPIGHAFDWLLDHGYTRNEEPVTASVRYTRDLVALVVEVVVAAPSGDQVVVELRWPDQCYPGSPVPTVSLDELEAMLGSIVPAGTGSDEDPLERASNRLAALARDALHGSLSVLFDALVWHWRSGPATRPDDWWGVPPYDDPEIRTGPRRSASDVRRDLAFSDLKLAWAADSRRAWPEIVAFVRQHPTTGEAEWLLEDVILDGGEPLLDELVALARTDADLGATIRGMHLGGFAGLAVERIEALQQELG